jgi:anthranilate synthase/aminodeoxychorismate synthase-like glutamine amidotransferase
MKVLIIDNYDSFVYNLAQYVGIVTDDVIVRRNDQVDVHDVFELSPDRIIISPGPGTPADPKYFRSCFEIILEAGRKIPVLGVCLGHQGIVHCFGGKIRKARTLRHGKTSLIRHDGKGVFHGLKKNPFLATRYHSLAADVKSLPDTLEISARSLDDGEIMGVRHRTYPIEGIQFHPESILTKVGRQIINNFLSQEAQVC